VERARHYASRQLWFAVAFVFALAQLASCSIDSSGFDGQTFKCNTAEPCPAGFTCEDGLCVRFSDPDADLTMSDANTNDANPNPPDADLSACGFPGQACCPGDVCNGGGCCDSATCVASGSDLNDGSLCLAGSSASCGGDGEACCANFGCDSVGACCVAGTCVANGQDCGGGYGTCTDSECQSFGNFDCGAAGSDCCDGTPNGNGDANDFCTQSGLVCTGTFMDQCETCGGAGQPCCEGGVCDAGGCCDHDPSNPVCVASGGSCPGGDGVCLDGGCQGGTCGKIGQAECTTAGCTGAFTELDNNVCVPCGGLDQECCDSESHKYCGAPYVCFGDFNDRTCVECGAIGQACCQGDLCASGTCSFFNSMCQ